MKKLLYSLSAIILIGLITGCKKDEEPATPESETCYFFQLKVDPEEKGNWVVKDEVIMDDNHQIVRGNQYSPFSPGQLLEHTGFEYNGTGKLSKATDFNASGVSYRYSQFDYNAQGNIEQQSMYERSELTDQFVQTEVWFYTYDTSNRLMERSTYNNGNPFYTEFEYDNKGNVKKESYYTTVNLSQVLTGSGEFKYDDKKNAYTGFNFLKFNAFSLSPNNVTASVYKDANGNIKHEESLNYTYSYNSQGYPVEVTLSTFAEPSVTVTQKIEYTCL